MPGQGSGGGGGSGSSSGTGSGSGSGSGKCPCCGGPTGPATCDCLSNPAPATIYCTITCNSCPALNGTFTLNSGLFSQCNPAQKNLPDCSGVLYGMTNWSGAGPCGLTITLACLCGTCDCNPNGNCAVACGNVQREKTHFVQTIGGGHDIVASRCCTDPSGSCQLELPVCPQVNSCNPLVVVFSGYIQGVCGCNGPACGRGTVGPMPITMVYSQ